MSRKAVYIFGAVASLTGYIWVLFNIISPNGMHTPNLCLFKNVTGIPCPSCGTTHSVLKLVQMDWSGALMENPLGYVTGAGLLVIPVWIIFDLLKGTSSFYNQYKKTEELIRKRWVAASLIMLITANWIWTILKYRA